MSIKIKNLSLHFPLATKPALDDVSYEIHNGDFVILLGTNGSGKSTLLKCLDSSYRTSSGDIYFLGKKLHDYSSYELSQFIGVLKQDSSASLFPALTIGENFLLVKQHKKIKMNKKEFLTYLAEFNPNLVGKYNQLTSFLSGGEKQTLALALCLLKPPKLLLLDEHTSALDPKTAKKIMQLTEQMISKYEITCILTTHDLDIAIHYGNRILILNQGKIQHHQHKAVGEVIKKENLLVNYF